MTIPGFDREPAVIISALAAVATGLVLSLSGNGFLSEAAAGKAVDLVNAVSQIALIAAPFLLSGLAIRSKVTSPATMAAIAAENDLT